MSNRLISRFLVRGSLALVLMQWPLFAHGKWFLSTGKGYVASSLNTQELTANYYLIGKKVGSRRWLFEMMPRSFSDEQREASLSVQQSQKHWAMWVHFPFMRERGWDAYGVAGGAYQTLYVANRLFSQAVEESETFFFGGVGVGLWGDFFFWRSLRFNIEARLDRAIKRSDYQQKIVLGRLAYLF